VSPRPSRRRADNLFRTSRQTPDLQIAHTDWHLISSADAASRGRDYVAAVGWQGCRRGIGSFQASPSGANASLSAYRAILTRFRDAVGVRVQGTAGLRSSGVRRVSKMRPPRTRFSSRAMRDPSCRVSGRVSLQTQRILSQLRRTITNGFRVALPRS